MFIADAQVHVWAADTPDRPWPGGRAEPQRAMPFGPDELLAEMDAAGVHRAVLVPPSWEGDRNDLALAAAEAHPDRLAVMGRLDVTEPLNANYLDTWRDQPGMLGLRFTFRVPSQRIWLADGTADWLWPEAERYEIPVMVYPPGQLDRIDRIATRYPGLKLVVDHLALDTQLRDAAALGHLSELLPLAKRPNIAVKASSLPAFVTEPYPYPSLRDPIHRVVDAFGPERVFWGTDITRNPASYRQAITHFTEELPFLSAPDKELIMGRALCNWLGWPVQG